MKCRICGEKLGAVIVGTERIRFTCPKHGSVMMAKVREVDVDCWPPIPEGDNELIGKSSKPVDYTPFKGVDSDGEHIHVYKREEKREKRSRDWFIKKDVQDKKDVRDVRSEFSVMLPAMTSISIAKAEEVKIDAEIEKEVDAHYGKDLEKFKEELVEHVEGKKPKKVKK